jgi:phosphoribosylamine--glycine ligase
MDAADALRKQGKCVVGPTKESSLWELNRGTGQEIFEKNGIETIPSEVFSNYDKAIAFIKKNADKRYVSKPSGDADKALSYVSKSPEDMIFMLERWKKNAKLKGEFIMQEFIPGIEMAVGGWIGPHGFNDYWCENFEFKKLMNDDLGPNTGEQGTVVQYVKKSKLAELVLAPLEEDLIATGHTGYVDVSVIIDEDGNPWPLEFTMRNGYPTFDIQAVLHEGDPAEWLRSLAEGEDAEIIIPNTVATGVVLAIPDYPYSHLTKKEVCGIPVYGIEERRENIHPCEMMMGSAPHNIDGKIKDQECLVTAGDYVLVATGTGETVKESAKDAYAVLKGLTVPNSPMFRSDIGKRLEKQLPELQKHGYATHLRYRTTVKPSGS